MREEITDLETFLMLDNNDFTRLKLTTKMVKTIQKLQKQLENDLVVEELEDQNEVLMTEANVVATCSTAGNNNRPINLDKVRVSAIHSA